MSMINEFVEKMVSRLDELRKVESDREDYSDNHNYYDDWEYAFEDGASDGRHYAYVKSIKIIKELAEEYKDVPDTNVGKNLSENLIKKIKFGIEASNINDDYTTGLRNGMRYCLSLIDGKEPKFESCKQGWIPVSEKLPDEESKVIVSTKTERVKVGIYTKKYGFGMKEGFICDDGFMYINTANAWQPLPEPYKGE